MIVLRKERKVIPVQKPSGQTTFTNYLLLTKKPASIRAGMRRNVRISKENKKLYVLLPYNACAHR